MIARVGAEVGSLPDMSPDPSRGWLWATYVPASQTFQTYKDRHAGQRKEILVAFGCQAACIKKERHNLISGRFYMGPFEHILPLQHALHDPLVILAA